MMICLSRRSKAFLASHCLFVCLFFSVFADSLYLHIYIFSVDYVLRVMTAPSFG